ncbi:nuclear apoptosis-inducing factor 1 [Chanos chanos]|uniref:Nuclear apoptosis-inducing factor 1 n=1 Tax=Chanos chanos TaxID=29144 RepID=A0A6J2W5F6_CHACN|nr:nuclear apoptosis-inducing factor 1-like [Chanos chanos]
MSASFHYSKDSVSRFKKRKARFTFSEVHILLDEVRKNRHIVVGKFNHGVPGELKKRTWAEITARVNEIGECEREVIEVIKKWSDLKCDTKRKVAALRSKGLLQRHARLTTELSPTENIVHQILEPDPKQGPEHWSASVGVVVEDEEDDNDEEDLGIMGLGSIHSSPGGGVDVPGIMPPPPAGTLGVPGSIPAQGTANVLENMVPSVGSRDSSQSSYDTQYEVPTNDDPDSHLMDSDEDHYDNVLPSSSLATPTNSVAHDDGPVISAVKGCVSLPPGHARVPVTPPHDRPTELSGSREHLLRSATLSVQEQHTTNALLETVSRSLELLAESVQQLAETQQEFVRESLQLQRDTLQVLREFATGALTIMHDKVNGRPTL